jgi:hypothetical protein
VYFQCIRLKKSHPRISPRPLGGGFYFGAHLEGNLLVVTVLGVLLVNDKRPLVLAVRAGGGFHVADSVTALNQRPDLTVAGSASIVEDRHLRVHPCAARNHPRNLDKSIQVRVPENSHNLHSFAGTCYVCVPSVCS